jgi:hypothetical protein
VSYAGHYQPLKLIPTSALDSPLALVTCRSNVNDADLWFAISLDRVRSPNFIHIFTYELCYQTGSEPDSWDEVEEAEDGCA